MDPMFKAGRELGKALAHLTLGKDPRSFIKLAAGDMRRAVKGLAPLVECAKKIDALSRVPERQIAGAFTSTIGYVRDQKLAPIYNRGYQAFCAGYLLGEVEEGLKMHSNSADLATARTQVTQRLTPARDHTVALETQCKVPGMKRFQSRFNSQISNVTSCRSNGALRSLAPHIVNLANQVGNAIQ